MHRAPAFGGTAALRIIVLGLLASTLLGCQFFKAAVVLFGRDETKKVAADYPYLAGKKVCVLVWADPYTLFEYRWAQLDLSEFVRVAIEGTVQGTSFIPSRQVVDYQDHNPDWDHEPPVAIGKRFGADRVILIELTEYTTREHDSPHLKRGHVAANVKVYDTAYPDAEAAYKTTIEAAYPPEALGGYGTDDRTVRREAMQAFAAKLAGKFYERTEKAD